MKTVQRTVSHLQQRLNAAINRSPLLNVRITASGRLLDCAQLATLDPELPGQLIDLALDAKGTLNCEFNLQDKRATEHQELYNLLDRNIRRHAERALRETGVHALWLGYPLIALSPHRDTNETPILAPLLLWPLELTPNLRQEGQLRIKPDKEAGSVRLNAALWSWVKRNLKLDLPGLTNTGKFDRADLDDFLATLASSFHTPPALPSLEGLTAIPDDDNLNAEDGPQLFNAAVLGSFQWPHAALLADLEALAEVDNLPPATDALLSGKPCPDHTKLKPLTEADRWEVYPADFSQQQVIQHTRHGHGLVVHGPPGTGKSQTIVNIIADALAHNKTVLMVCQKQAALQVVHERLRAVKLDELCVQVNDADTDRLTVFREIRNQVERLPPDPEPFDNHARTAFAEQITMLEKALDDHAKHLHTPLPGLDIDYPAVLALSAQLASDWSGLKVLPGLQRALRGIGKNSLEAVCEPIRAAGNLFGQAQPLTNLWRERHASVRTSAAFQSEITHQIDTLRDLDQQHIAYVETQTRPVQLPEQVTAFSERIQSVLNVLDELKTADTASNMLLAWLRAVRSSGDTVLQRHQRNMKEAVKIAESVSATPLDPDWHGYCGHLPDDAIATLGNQALSVSRHHRRWWRHAFPGFANAVEALQALRPTPDDLLRDVATELHRYTKARQLRAQLRYCCQTLTPGIACHDDGEAIQTGFIMQSQQALKKVLWLREQEQAQPWLSPFITQIQQEPAHGLAALRDEVAHTLERIPLADSLLQQLKSLETHFNDNALLTPTKAIHEGRSIADWLDDLQEGLTRLPALISYEEAAKKRGPARILLEALEHYEAQRATGSTQPAPPEGLAAEEYGIWWEQLTRFAAVAEWQQVYEQEAPELLSFNAEAHANQVRQLAELIEQKRELEADTLLNHWLNQQIPLRAQPWKRLFQLRGSRAGPAKRLREAVALGLPDGLLTLRPCWLTNPETAAQIFPLQAELFDVVIFDEASQCPVEQAVSIAYRGKSLVVCGDEKQLPPTSFFTANWDTEVSETDDAHSHSVIDSLKTLVTRQPPVLECEDILQASIGCLPEKYLRVHYRSRHPDLIEFSNRAFYGDLLETLPLAEPTGEPVIRYDAINGCYHNRRNPDEVARVVEIIERFWQQERAPSIGVVTFNQRQRDAIEDALAGKCRDSSSFASLYQRETTRRENNQDTGLFVKNLETVQGDERDIIIFSTTFGPDETGRFYRRFGPVGAVGGERRLNVAVTRAKQQVIVVSSIPLEELTHIAQDDTGLTPAGYLAHYLNYAQAVSNRDSQRLNHTLSQLGKPSSLRGQWPQPHQALLDDIRQVIESRGYEAHLLVGSAGFRIDIGVYQPLKGYILGIECDTGPWQPERHARLREVWRASQLRQRGWRLHRIWSVRWWTQRSQEIGRLKELLP